MDQKRIQPHHQFQHLGRRYVINIEEMQASAIDDALARTLARLAASPTEPMDAPAQAQLAKLGLLTDGESEAAHEERGAPVPVVNAALFLTQSCNLRCVYCYGDGGSYGTGGDMSQSTAFQAVDWLIAQSGRMKQIHVGFFGGEPFLRFPLMRAVVAYARRRAQAAGKEVDFNATTNGTLLNDEKVAFIDENKMAVMLSFDGPREIQDAQRPFADGKGSYDAIVPGIRKLLAATRKVKGHAVLAGQTDPQAVRDALREIGLTEVSLIPASASLFAGRAGAAAPQRDIAAVLKLLEEEARTWVRRIQERDSESLRALKSKSQLWSGMVGLLHNEKRLHACGAGLGMVGVSCAGDVYLCHRFVGVAQYRLGSVFHQELDRAKYGESPVTLIAACAACFARYYCAGGCKHDNAGSCGSAFAPAQDMCRLRRRELELAAAVAGGLDPADRAFLEERDIVPPKPCPLDF